jgi:hypothetical protein
MLVLINHTNQIAVDHTNIENDMSAEYCRRPNYRWLRIKYNLKATFAVIGHNEEL